jgi:hypothetical protein
MSFIPPLVPGALIRPNEKCVGSPAGTPARCVVELFAAFAWSATRPIAQAVGDEQVVSAMSNATGSVNALAMDQTARRLVRWNA